jgi:hypothetical protein
MNTEYHTSVLVLALQKPSGTSLICVSIKKSHEWTGENKSIYNFNLLSTGQDARLLRLSKYAIAKMFHKMFRKRQPIHVWSKYKLLKNSEQYMYFISEDIKWLVCDPFVCHIKQYKHLIYIVGTRKSNLMAVTVPFFPEILITVYK